MKITLRQVLLLILSAELGFYFGIIWPRPHSTRIIYVIPKPAPAQLNIPKQ